MRTRFSQAPGVSFRGIGLQTGPCRGIEIDNGSGAWLYIPTLEVYVPPYTVDWAAIFPYDVASLDVIAGNGPSGQKGTSKGDPVTVWLTSDPDMRAPADGIAVIPTAQNPSALSSAAFAATAVPAPGTGVLFLAGPPPTNIMRLFAASLSYDMLTPSTAGASSPVELILFRNIVPVPEPLAVLEITPGSPFAPWAWPAQGYDLQLGESLAYNLIALDTNMNVNMTVTYGLI